MVKFIIARQLLGMKLVTNDGFDVGKIVDVMINEITGKITDIVVEPNMDSKLFNKMKVENGQTRVPYNSLLAVNDYAVIERKNW